MKGRPPRLKLKFPYHNGGRRDRAATLYCDRCRIKNGLQSTRLMYGKCSFCGFTTRCNAQGTRRVWYDWPLTKRKTSVWSRNRKDR